MGVGWGGMRMGRSVHTQKLLRSVAICSDHLCYQRQQRCLTNFPSPLFLHIRNVIWKNCCSWVEGVIQEAFFSFFFFFGFLVFQGCTCGIWRFPGQESNQNCAYPTATWDLSHIYNLQHSSGQRRILNPLSKASDGTHVLMDASRVH